MLKINKKSTPDELLKYKKHNKCSSYESLPRELKKELKKSLLEEQNYYCCYCCRGINDNDSNIEHIVPQRIVKDTLDYNNLLASCDSNIQNKDEMTCNVCKGGKYDEKLFISPIDCDCESFFQFNIGTGVMESIYDKNTIKGKKAKFTIGVLNLNSKKLSSERYSIIRLLTSMCQGGLTAREVYDIMIKKRCDFPDVIKWYLINYQGLKL